MFLSAKSASVYDLETFRCKFQRNAYQKMPCASTTKVATALFIIENFRLDDKVEISSSASRTPYSSLSTINYHYLTIQDLLHLLLLKSDNGAAIALAEYAAGSELRFVKLLNSKLKSIGCCSTSLKNPHGLPCLGHSSTARDLALLERTAIQNKTYKKITASPSYKIKGSCEKTFMVHNNNPLLHTKGFSGVKTGWTHRAGYCLVATYEENQRSSVVAVLGCLTRKASISEAQILVKHTR